MQIQSLTTPTSRLMCCQSAANDTDYIPQNPLPSVFLVEQGVEYNQFGFSVGLCPRQALCPSLAYLLWGTERRKKVLLSSSQNTCVLSALLWSQIQNTAPSLEHELHGSRTQGTHSLHLASAHLLCLSSCWYGCFCHLCQLALYICLIICNINALSFSCSLKSFIAFAFPLFAFFPFCNVQDN